MHIGILKSVGAHKFQNTAHHIARHDTSLTHFFWMITLRITWIKTDKLYTEHKWL